MSVIRSMRNPNVFKASRRIAVVAAAISMGFHLAVLFGTPAFDLSWSDVPTARLEAVLKELPPPPKVARAAAPRVQKPATPARAKDAMQSMPDALAHADPSESEEAEPQELIAADADEVKPEEAPVAHYPIRHLRLVYDLHYGENGVRVGKVVHTWASDDEHYRVESVAQATGFFSAIYGGKFIQRATGTFGPHGLVPAEYTLERGSADNTETARFDWSNAKLTLSRKGESNVVDLPDDAHDVLSIVHQLYFMQPLPPTAELRVATSRRIGAHVYRVEGNVEMDTPVGALTAVHIQRVSDDGDRMELWLDPKHAMVPLRILVVDSKGTILDQRIRGIEAEPVATASASVD